jgi:hypothetical protein
MKLILSILLLFTLQAEGQVIRANPYYRPIGCSPSLLLDQYSGAAAAYSLRKIRCDYTGAAIRVKRSSDNSEQDINFLSSGELDTASLKTFVGTGGSDDGFVVTWYDQSGSSNNATQSTAGNQPKIMDNGVVLRTNGKPKVSLGNSAEAWGLLLPSGFLNAQTELTWVAVLKVNDFGGSNTGFFGPSNTGSVGLEILQHTAVSRRTLLRINNVRRNDNAGAAYQLWNDAAQSLTEIYGNATDVGAYKNNAAVTLTSSVALPSLNFNGIYAIGWYFSAFNNVEGEVQELIIYYSDKRSNRTDIASNINTYYSIY